MKLEQLDTPSLLIDADALDGNLRRMQARCDATGTELWPHIKTHKLVPLLRKQLELGARGATCAKLGEAEAMLPSGVRRIFLAHSLADPRKAARLRQLHEQLDQLILAVTSEVHFLALERLLCASGIRVDVLLAVDTGLGREGTRSPEASVALSERIRASPAMNLTGLYTHEGHAYGNSGPAGFAQFAEQIHTRMKQHADAIGGDLTLWPGCSVTAALLAGEPGVKAVRPGSYIFGDLSLSDVTRVTAFTNNALTVLAGVVDLPEPGLALIDAGSKVFSSDKTPEGVSGRCWELPEITVRRLNEEHGYLAGAGVDKLTPGDRLRFVPAHVCTVVNLADRVHLVRGETVLETWPVDARGRSD